MTTGLALHRCVLHSCGAKRTATARAAQEPAATAQRRLPTSSLDIVNEDLQFLQQHAGKDWDTLKDAHDLVAAYLNPVIGEQREQEAEEQVQVLQTTLQAAHEQVHSSEELLGESVMRLSELERSAAQFRFTAEGPQPQPSSSSSTAPSETQPQAAHAGSAALPTSPALTQPKAQQQHQQQQVPSAEATRKLGADTGLPANLQNFWFPAEFSSRLQAGAIVPLELFHQRWVLFRDSAGRASCIRDTCAHRACPLSLGQVVDGGIQCPYHGWTYDGQGRCTGMPSTQFRPGVQVDALPVSETGGFIWLWPGAEAPSELIVEAVQPPSGFQVHAELQLEVPVDHGLLVENLLDLAHAPFTHTTTFAKGWPVPDVVKFQAQQLLAGHWEPYPIDMSFEPPCMVLSTIGLAQPGKIMRGVRASHCQNHLHQLHVCLPSGPGRTRLLYRMSMDFVAWTRHIPFIQNFWTRIANQVLGEDLVLVKGQQERMGQGADVWANPVAYDKLGVRYRRWRNSLVLPKSAPARREAEEELVQTMSAGAIFASQQTTDIQTQGKDQA